MGVKLLKPLSGDANVKKQTEVLLFFDKGEFDEVFIKVDGNVAVRDGRTQKGFTTTHKEYVGDKIKWGLRKRGGFPSRDILVQAQSSPDCYSIEQRFFVKGAKAFASFSPDRKNWCLTQSGIFSSDKTPTRFNVDIEDFPIPDKIINESQEFDFAKYDNDWRYVGCSDDKTFLIGPDLFRIFPFQSYSPKICKDLINVRLNPNETAHIPFTYIPSELEKSWYTFSHSPTNIEFGNEIHVWWEENRFITKRNPDPISGYSEDLIWTKQDIKAPIRKVTIVGPNTILINNNIVVNIDYPRITRI